jgi:shikimate kinase
MLERCIVITGFMGAGKTSVAQALGVLMNCEAIDLDEEITRLNHSSPMDLITNQGEKAFREIETEVLRQVLDRGAKLIALGGGAWTIPGNRELLTVRSCLTVWLDVPFEACWPRIVASGSGRPLAPNREHARSLYETRRALYQMADVRIEASDEMTASEVAKLVQRSIGSV